jgi:hypothetical protein
VIRVRRGADPDLIVRFPSGLHGAIAMSWTNYASASAETAPTVAIHLLEINGLRQMAQWIEHLHQVDQGLIVSKP